MEEKIRVFLQHFADKKENSSLNPNFVNTGNKLVVNLVAIRKSNNRTGKVQVVYGLSDNQETNLTVANTVLVLVEYDKNIDINDNRENNVAIYLANLSRLVKHENIKNVLPITSLIEHPEGQDKDEHRTFITNSIAAVKNANTSRNRQVEKLFVNNKPYHYIERLFTKMINEEFVFLEKMYQNLKNENNKETDKANVLTSKEAIQLFVDEVTKNNNYAIEEDKNAVIVTIPYKLTDGSSFDFCLLCTEKNNEPIVTLYIQKYSNKMLYFFTSLNKSISLLSKNSKTDREIQDFISFVTDEKGNLVNLIENASKYTKTTSFNLQVSDLINIYKGHEFISIPLIRYTNKNIEENNKEKEWFYVRIKISSTSYTEILTAM